ncbi:hypothetical protein HK097_009061, partial [Rhizophlyctis rosea]
MKQSFLTDNPSQPPNKSRKKKNRTLRKDSSSSPSPAPPQLPSSSSQTTLTHNGTPTVNANIFSKLAGLVTTTGGTTAAGRKTPTLRGASDIVATDMTNRAHSPDAAAGGLTPNAGPAPLRRSPTSEGWAISPPSDFKKVMHVDKEWNWFGEGDPRDLFRLDEKLGEGAFGSVYKATLTNTGFILAVKQIVIGSRESERVAIQKEIDLLKTCKHRNIVQYYGCVPVNEAMWILTDYCGAGSLVDCMELTRQTFSELQAAIILASALEGLAYLHEHGVVHRDVKSANILLTEQGEVKIADFGVSERLTQTIAARRTVVGTPFWMSPEVITGSGYGTEADIWSLGITAIEMTEGVPPHAEMRPMQAMFKIPFLPPPTLSEPSSFSETFNSFIAQCLTKAPAERPTAKTLLRHPFVEEFVDVKGVRIVDVRRELLEKIREAMTVRREMRLKKEVAGSKEEYKGPTVAAGDGAGGEDDESGIGYRTVITVDTGPIVKEPSPEPNEEECEETDTPSTVIFLGTQTETTTAKKVSRPLSTNFDTFRQNLHHPTADSAVASEEFVR